MCSTSRDPAADPLPGYAAPIVDYPNSPHLAQWPLRRRLLGVLYGVVEPMRGSDRSPTVLELGASHGGYTGELLASGCAVTRVEMSERSWRSVIARYGNNPDLKALWDPDASLTGTPDGHDLALCLSVMHHVADYLSLLDRVVDRLRPGAALLTLQDPLWYPRLSATTLRFDRAAYLAWRLDQGDLGGGMRAMRRRLRGEYPESGPNEVPYHHVVRQGVDEEAVAEHLRRRFRSVDVFSYWSNHLAASRRPAELLGLVNTFGVLARGLAPGGAPPADGEIRWWRPVRGGGR